MPTGLVENSCFGQRHVMDRALGERRATPHLWKVPVHDSDVVLAVSDGVTNNHTLRVPESGCLGLIPATSVPTNQMTAAADQHALTRATSVDSEIRFDTAPPSVAFEDPAARVADTVGRVRGPRRV